MFKCKSIFVWIFISIILFSNINYSQQINLKEKFSVGLVNWLLSYKYRVGLHSQWYSDLNIDLQISYTNRDDIDIFYYNGKKEYGGFKDLVQDYSQNINATLNTGNTQKYLERAKIVRPAYGQRSTYQAEPIPGVFPQYGYAGHTTGTDKNITILPGASLTFSDSSGIELDGGTFTCGDYSSENPVTFI